MGGTKAEEFLGETMVLDRIAMFCLSADGRSSRIVHNGLGSICDVLSS